MKTVESKIPMIFLQPTAIHSLGTRNRESLEKVTKVRVFFEELTSWKVFF